MQLGPQTLLTLPDACRYELRAVEGALAAAVRSYEAEVTALETRLLPCLHKLLRKVPPPPAMTPWGRLNN